MPTEPRKTPTFDIPGMGRMTAAEYAAHHNASGAPGTMTARADGRGIVWTDNPAQGGGTRGILRLDSLGIPSASSTWARPQPPFATLFREPPAPPRPLDYIGAQPC